MDRSLGDKHPFGFIGVSLEFSKARAANHRRFCRKIDAKIPLLTPRYFPSFEPVRISCVCLRV